MPNGLEAAPQAGESSHASLSDPALELLAHPYTGHDGIESSFFIGTSRSGVTGITSCAHRCDEHSLFLHCVGCKLKHLRSYPIASVPGMHRIQSDFPHLAIGIQPKRNETNHLCATLGYMNAPFGTLLKKRTQQFLLPFILRLLRNAIHFIPQHFTERGKHR